MLRFLEPERQSEQKMKKPKQTPVQFEREKSKDDLPVNILMEQKRRNIRLQDEPQTNSTFKPPTQKGPPRKEPPSGVTRPTRGDEDDEFERLAKMIELISKRLGRLVSMKRHPLPQELHTPISRNWPAAQKSLKSAASKLRNKRRQRKLRPELEAAGLTGEMLGMKETSITYHLGRMEKAVLTYGRNESMLERFVRWIKPGFSVINSILGSLPLGLGTEVAKEFKEHLEAAYEVVETGQPE